MAKALPTKTNPKKKEGTTMTEAKKADKFEGITKAQAQKLEGAELSALKNSLLSKALTELKLAHQGDFEKIAEGLFSDLGLKRARRLTPTERKRKQLAELATELGVDISSPRTAESINTTEAK